MSYKISFSSGDEDIKELSEATHVKLESLKDHSPSIETSSIGEQSSHAKYAGLAGHSEESKNIDSRDIEEMECDVSDIDCHDSSDEIPDKLTKSFIIALKEAENLITTYKDSDAKFTDKNKMEFSKAPPSDDLFVFKVPELPKYTLKRKRKFVEQIYSCYVNNPAGETFWRAKKVSQGQSSEKTDSKSITPAHSSKYSKKLVDDFESLYAPSTSTGARRKISTSTLIEPKESSQSTDGVIESVRSIPEVRNFQTSYMVVKSHESVTKEKIISDVGSVSTEKASGSTNPFLEAMLSTKVETDPLPISLAEFSEEKSEVEEPSEFMQLFLQLPELKECVDLSTREKFYIFKGYKINTDGWIEPIENFNTSDMLVNFQTIRGKITNLRNIERPLEDTCNYLNEEFRNIMHDLGKLYDILATEMLGYKLTLTHETINPATGPSLLQMVQSSYNVLVKRLKIIQTVVETLREWLSDKCKDDIKDFLEAALRAKRNNLSYLIRPLFHKLRIPPDTNIQYFGDTLRLVHVEVHSITLLELLYPLIDYILEKFFYQNTPSPQEDPVPQSEKDSDCMKEGQQESSASLKDHITQFEKDSDFMKDSQKESSTLQEDPMS